MGADVAKIAGLLTEAQRKAVRAGLAVIWEARFGAPLTESEWLDVLRLYEMGAPWLGWRKEIDGILAALDAHLAAQEPRA